MDNSINTTKSKKGPAIVLVSIISILLLAILIVSIILFTPIFKSPKQKLLMAATKTFYTEPSKLYGSDGILLITLLAGGDFEYETELALDKINIEEDALGLYYDNNYKMAAGVYLGQEGYIDIPERQSFISTTVRYNSFRLTQTDVYLDDDDVYITDSHLMDGNIYFNTKSFGKDYQSSMYSQYIQELPYTGKIMDEALGDVSFNVYDTLESIQAYATKLTFKKGNGTYTALKNIYDEADVTITGKTKDYTIGGKSTKCQEYQVIIPKEALTDLKLPGFEDFIDTLDDDFEFYVYIDKSYRIIAITHDIPSLSYEIEIAFTGEKYLLSDISLDINLTNTNSGDDIINASSTYSYNAGTKEFMLEADINDNSFSAEGTLETTTDSFTLNSEDMVLELNTKLITGTLDFSGALSMNRPEDDVPTLSGKDYILMDMDEDDWIKIVETITENFFPF